MFRSPLHRKLWIFLLANVFLCRSAFPQQGAPPLPSTKPAPGAHWTIAYEKKAEEPPSKPAKTSSKRRGKGADQKPAKGDNSLQSEEYRVTPEMSCATKKYENGSEQTIYIVKGVAYQTSADGKSVAALSLSGTANAEVLFTEHYPGLDWVQAKHYAGTEQQGEQKRLHYHRTASSKPPVDANPQVYDPFVTYLDCDAWIDADTGLPVAFSQGKIHGTYQFLSSEQESIPLPEEVALAIKRYNGEP